MLLCLSSGGSRSVFEEPVEVAGEVALEAAGSFATALPFLAAAFDVGDRVGVCAAAGDDDHVQRPVELPVAATVEPVTGRLARRGRDRRTAGESCEGGFRAHASVV